MAIKIDKDKLAKYQASRQTKAQTSPQSSGSKSAASGTLKINSDALNAYQATRQSTPSAPAKTETVYDNTGRKAAHTETMTQQRSASTRAPYENVQRRMDHAQNMTNQRERELYTQRNEVSTKRDNLYRDDILDAYISTYNSPELKNKEDWLANLPVDEATKAAIRGGSVRSNPDQDYYDLTAELKRLDNEIAQYNVDKTRSYYDQLRQNEDFEEKSQYNRNIQDSNYAFVNARNVDDQLEGYIKTYQSPELQDPEAWLASLPVDETVRQQIREGAAGKPVYNYNQPYDYDSLDYRNAGGITRWSQLTDDEVSIYNYLYATEGADQADAYLDSLYDQLGFRESAATSQMWRDFAGDVPVLSDALSVPLNLVGGVIGATDLGVQALRHLLTGAPIDANSAAMQFANAGQDIRGYRSEQLSNLGGPTLLGNNLWSTLYQTGMSGLDSLAAGYLGAGLGGQGKLGQAITEGILSSSAASSTARDIAQRGGSGEQILLGALASGVFEAFFENMSIETLPMFNEVPITSLWDVVSNMSKSFLTNASEEMNTELANILFDSFVMGDVSEYQTSIDDYAAQYMAIDPTLTEEEARAMAKRQVFTDFAYRVLESGASGGLMGLGFGAMSSVGSTVNLHNTGYNFAAVDADGSRLQTLINNGLRADPSSKLYQQAQKVQNIVNNGETANDHMVGVLYMLSMEDAEAKAEELRNAPPDWGENPGYSSYVDPDYVARVREATTPPSERLLNTARSQYTEGGRVSNRTADAIYADADAMAALRAETGLQLTDAQERNASMRRRAIQDAVARRETSRAASEAVDTNVEPAVQSIGENNAIPSPANVQTVSVPATPQQTVATEPFNVDVRSAQDSVARAVQAAEQSLGTNGARAMRAVYDADMATQVGPAEAYEGFSKVYEAARDGRAIPDVSIPRALVIAAQSAGQRDAALVTSTVSREAARFGNAGARAFTSAVADMGITDVADVAKAAAEFSETYVKAAAGQEVSTEGLSKIQTAAAVAGAKDYSAKNGGTNRSATPGLVKNNADYVMSRVSAKQANMLDALGKALGLEIRFDSTMGAGENASIKDGVIRISTKTRNPLRVALTHELVHLVRASNASAYWEMVNFVYAGMRDGTLSQLQKLYGQTYEMDNLRPDQITEEMVADAFATILRDSGYMEKFARQHGQAARSLLSTLKDLAAKIKRYLSGSKGKQLNQVQVNAFKDLQSYAEEAERILTGALNAIAENRANEAAEKVGVNIDAETESANPEAFSRETWTASEYVKDRDKAAKQLATALQISQDQAKQYIDNINSIAKIIADDAVRLDYESAPGMSSFVSNAEYGGSIDFSTICKKRRLLTGTFEAIQNALPNTALTVDEVLTIRDMMKKRGYEVSCGLCYVEGSRAKMGEYTKAFIDKYKATNPAYVPTMAEMNTATGQENMRRTHPEVYEAYMYFMNHYGRINAQDKEALFPSQGKPKTYQMATAYDGEILKKFKNGKNVDQKNANGGLRLQSFSDFEIIHLIDCMQVIMDMSRVGLAGQAYTKVPDFARALGGTGLKINLSLIAKSVENGKIVLDEVEGMKRSDAEALRNKYSNNVGTIIVVFNDEQLRAAMADDFIDFIIPFHKSQWSKGSYGLLGLPENAKDYTPWQNESYIEAVYDKNGKKLRPSNYMPNNYWDFSKSGKENAEAYLQMCAENNKKPKFSHLLVDNGDGSYSLQADGSTDGYWKLLIDFKMYNNEGVGVPQAPVSPEFDMAEAERMLNDYEGGHARFPAAQDVVDDFVAEYKESHPGVRYSRTLGGNEREVNDGQQNEATGTESGRGNIGLQGRPFGAYARSQRKAKNIVTEDIESFRRRILAADDGWKINQYGSIQIAYKPTTTLTETQRRMQQYGSEKGINIVPVEGTYEHNNGVRTVTNSEATTIGNTIYVSSDATNSADNIFNHEFTHILRDNNSPVYYKAYEHMVNNVLAAVRANGKISDAIIDIGNSYVIRYDQSGNVVETFDVDNFDHLRRAFHELIAYVNGYNAADPAYARETFADSFSDYDAFLKSLDEMNKATLPRTEENMRYSREVDAQYLAAVNAGDMETAQRMVDEAAEAAGYTIKAYHGSRNIFTKFSPDARGSNTGTVASKSWFFAGDFDTANSYYPAGVISELMKQYPNMYNQTDIERLEKRGIAGKLYSLYLKMENPLEVDVAGYDYAAHRENADAFSEIIEQAEREGRDGIILRNVRDNQLRPSEENSTVYMFRDSTQAKSADPVTYDDADNVIPLSERFNTANEDIRFSRTISNENYRKALDDARLGGEMGQGREDAKRMRKVVDKYEAKLEKQRALTDNYKEALKQAVKDGRISAQDALLAGQMAQGREDAARIRRIEEKNARAQTKLRERLAAEKEDKRTRLAELKTEITEKYNDRLATVRADRDAKISEMKQTQREKDAAARESRKAREIRTKIVKHVSNLSKTLLGPTNEKHIPQQLQGPVARLLESINLESKYEFVLGEDGKYHRIPAGTDSTAAVTKRTEAFQSLKTAYSKIGGELVIDPDLFDEGQDPGILSQVIELGNKRIADMNSEELSTLYTAIKMVEASVRNANKMFNSARWETVSAAAEALMLQNGRKKAVSDYVGGFGKLQKLTGLDMMTPQAYFHRLDDAGDTLFRMLRDAQDQHIRILADTENFTHALLAQYNLDVNKIEETMHTVTLGGQQVEMTTAQLMNLFNLIRRGDQAIGHILAGGGLEIDPIQKKRSVKYTARPEAIRNITMDELIGAVNQLGANEINAAVAMSEYLAGPMGDLGNKASMEVYGYEKFGEEHYWPIISSGKDLTSSVEKDTQITSVGGRGFTKALKPKANTALRIGSAFDVFANHCTEMATYASYLAPMQDLNRIRNFQFRDSSGNRTSTIKELFTRVYGAGGNAYLSKLMADISNGVKGRNDDNFASSMVSKFKVSAVGGNLRVIVQQPTAILRALSMIKGKHMLIGAAANPMAGWKLAMQYAPIAQWKDWGYFEINTGRQIRDVLFETDSKLNKVQNKLMAGAAFADSVSWGLLWNACEAEMRSSQKDLTPGTTAYYEAVAKRFTEIIDNTQVVDGILQRSQIMRSSDGLTKMATSFMAEPTKQYNMLMSAIYDVRNSSGNAQVKAKGALKRTVIALAVSGVVNATVQSLVDALRRNDRDEDYWEAWLEAFVGINGSFWDSNLFDMMNPVGYIPYIKDVLSLVQGFYVTRTDMDVISDVVSSSKNFIKSMNGNGKQSTTQATMNLLATIAKLFGLPLSSLKRDMDAIVKTIINATGNVALQYQWDTLLYNQATNKSRFIDLLYEAYKTDRQAYQMIRRDLIKRDQLATATMTTEEYIDRYLNQRINKEAS